MKKRVLLGMSGGVDSAVAAYLLKNDGYEVIGVTMSLCVDNSEDIADAKRVASMLGIEHITVDFSEDFKEKVVDNFIKCYKDGETPNPCVECNKFIKFGKMFELADEMDAQYIATGHYARIEKDENGRPTLKKAKDQSKDQTYMLYNLSEDKLNRILFPLGELSKAEAREIAEAQGFVNARKKDSQDICFVPDGKYAEFIEKTTGEIFPDGDFVTTDGTVIGRHNGIIRYTIGQRKGLGVAFGHPIFVISKNAEDNTVVLGENEELFSTSLTAHDVNLINRDEFAEPTGVLAKIRYNQTEQPASAVSIGEGRIRIEFEAPQRAVSRGQSVVLYDNDTVVGGGIID